MDGESIDAYEARVRAACPVGYTVAASETNRSGSIRTAARVLPAADPPRPTTLDAEAVEFAKSFFQSKLVTCGTRAFAYIYRYGDPRLTEISAPRFVAHPDLAKRTNGDVMNGVDYEGEVQLELDASRTWEGGKWTEWETDTLQVGVENSVFTLKVQHRNGRWSGHAPLAALIGRKKVSCASVPTR
jgi:hypothetical protein